MTPREEELLRKLAERDAEIALLKQKVDLLIKRIFGAKSETLSPDQLELLLGPEKPGKADASSEKEEAKFTRLTIVRENGERKARPLRQPRIPDHLPAVIEVIEPDEVKAAPEQWRYIGDEISEQLDYEPGHFFKRQLIRRKYVERSVLDPRFAIAPLPPVLQERCIAAPGLLAQIIVDKFAYHQPLHRQEGHYRLQHRMEIPRQTMARWIGMAADWLAPVYREIQSNLFSKGYIQVDETPIKYLSPGHGSTRQGYLWSCKQPETGDVFFQWHTSRSAECLKSLIPSDFEGILQCDGYAAYDRFARQHGSPLLLAGCYAHIRREFWEAREEAPQMAGWILRQIAHLYQVEKRLRKQRAGPRLRLAYRASHSRIIHRRLERLLIQLKRKGRYLPKSQMGRAIAYALGQWESLNVYLEHGHVCIDNNPVENAIRPTAVGKKNWLFIGDATTGERSAILYTLIENCRLQGIDPYTYLRDLLSRLPYLTNRQIGSITPAACLAAKNGRLLKLAS